MTGEATRRATEAVFRIERARLIAGLVRIVRDVDRAEELAQEALLVALAEWPSRGLPDRPGAWLMAAARRRAIDGVRHDRMRDRKHAELGRETDLVEHGAVERLEAALDDEIGDELLSLIFTACHPVLSAQSRAALTLRLIGGLTVEEIARSFVSSEPTIAQRITRAKRTIRETGVAFEVPQGEERAARLASVLEVIYLIFNEGYAATAGDDLIRPAVCAEAQRLGRILAAAMPKEPEVFGLLALMEIQASRLPARTGADGAFVPLIEQDRSRWDGLLIRRGMVALKRAEALSGADGAYALQAAIGACHARARSAEDTDWPRIAGLYDRLQRGAPSPVVALNRAIAHSMAFGPKIGLALIEEISGLDRLEEFAPLHAARADMLYRAGSLAEAKHEFEAAAGFTRNAVERSFLLSRAELCASLLAEGLERAAATANPSGMTVRRLLPPPDGA